MLKIVQCRLPSIYRFLYDGSFVGNIVITVFVFERAVGPLELRNNIILDEISRIEPDPIAGVIQRGKKRAAEVSRSVNNVHDGFWHPVATINHTHPAVFGS